MMRPLFLVLVLLAAPFLAGCVGPREEPDAIVIDVEVSRYRFDPGTTESIVVPKGSIVVFRVRSLDVTHGFAVEGLHTGVSIPPGEVVEVRVRADQVGTFRIYCTVFCGAGHPDHKGTLVVTGG